MTQLRAFGALSGARYGSFEGKAQAARDVDKLTQWRAHGTGRRFGSFAGKTDSAASRPITQWRAYGTGRRYGAFSGKTPAPITPPVVDTAFGGGSRQPRRLRIDARHLQALEEDELMLAIIAAALQSGLLDYQ